MRVVGGDKRAEIEKLLRAGKSNKAVAAAVGRHPMTVVKVRKELGLPRHRSAPSPVPLEEAWRAGVRWEEGGHARWTGWAPAGLPRVMHGRRALSARKIAFRMRYGREPQGQVLAECGESWCVAPEHVQDLPGREQIRALLAAVAGLPQRGPCRRGHDWAMWGRRLPDGTGYCAGCLRIRRSGMTRREP